MFSTIGFQVASGCSAARMASSSPELRMRKKSSTVCSCGVLAVTTITPPCAMSALARLLAGGGVHFRESLARDARRVDARRDAAVHRDLQDDLADLLARETVVQRGLHVQLQLVGTIQRADHRDVDDA